MLTGVTFIAAKKGSRWNTMLYAWVDDEDDPSIEEDDWASGNSAEEALAHATIRLGTDWEKLKGDAAAATR